MSGKLRNIILATDTRLRNTDVAEACAGLDIPALLHEADDLDAFRRECENLYERVRALFLLYALHRFELPSRKEFSAGRPIPWDGYQYLLNRRFEEAIGRFRSAGEPGDSLSSGLAVAYQRLAIQTLADQVRRSVRSVRGNQWMFRVGHAADHPLRVHPRLLEADPSGLPPILRELTPVRMDLSHSGWSDIFFLGMDYPEGARVLNVSIDLAVHGRDASPRPPVEAYLRVIDEPVIRLTSVDLGATSVVRTLEEVFDFAKDYLGLLKAAVIAAGIVPPGLEGSGQPLQDVLGRVFGNGRGIELVSSVNNIPKGSRLAVSTNLLAALVTVLMRATGQTHSLEGPLEESERRTVAARAILGEWLGGSGGGWQDSGGVWPGIKRIHGVLAQEGDPEFGISKGRLLPNHELLGRDRVGDAAREALQRSLVLVHGGMAQNVGPILEMVTEKYLLRSSREWQARQDALVLFEQIVAALEAGDMRLLGSLTTRNFRGPIQSIIPWATNAFTESLISAMEHDFGADFFGFWMLGGMSGGGMGLIVDPTRQAEARERALTIMTALKRRFSAALPFAMEPVVYDFAINETGTCGALLAGGDLPLPPGYYRMRVPELLRGDARSLTPTLRRELEIFGAACEQKAEFAGMAGDILQRMVPASGAGVETSRSLDELLAENGFDAEQHEQIRAALRSGRIGLAQNRLPASTLVEDVEESDVSHAAQAVTEDDRRTGLEALAAGEVAVFTLAAGAGSRWTQGAGVVKAINPFCKLAGAHRTFLEVHLAKSRRAAHLTGTHPPHIVSTSYLTHEPIREWLDAHHGYGYPEEELLLSPGRSIGLRMVPCVRDLRFAWEEMPVQILDERQQRVRESLHAALIAWARSTGEANDYRDNLPSQCLHPVGHWYEIPNLLRNGVLRDLLARRPELRTLLLHNIDTLGASLDPGLLGLHRRLGGTLTYEVIARRIEDRGGGLARIDGRPRLVEGLAMPHEEDEFRLSYYNTQTTWIEIDRLLDVFELDRAALHDEAKVTAAIRKLAMRLPTYVTLKDVKKRWGHGQEDVFPVSQFEKLWSDMTALPSADCRFVVVPRTRGQQLKEPSQLDGWLRDGSAAAVEALCVWTS